MKYFKSSFYCSSNLWIWKQFKKKYINIIYNRNLVSMKPFIGFIFADNNLDYLISMKCLSCSHSWKRSKWTEYISFLSMCPGCGSRLLARNDLIKSIINIFKYD